MTTTLLSDGKEMDAKYGLISVEVIKTVGKIPLAQIVLSEGRELSNKFELSDQSFFEPGKKIEVKVRYEADPKSEATVFKGVVVKHAVRIDADKSCLIVDLKDDAIKLLAKRKSTVYKDQTDADIIKKAIGNSGGTAGQIATTTGTHPQMVQYQCTDWDFVLSRTDANGHWVIVDDGTISTIEPKLSGSAAHTYEYDIDQIYAIEMNADIQHQRKKVESAAWDANKLGLTAKKDAKDFSLAQGNLDPAEMAGAVGGDDLSLVDAVALIPEETEAWANARMVKDRLSMMRGYIEVKGDGSIKPGELMALKGMGERFNGTTLISGVRHQIDSDGWRTAVQFGVSAKWFAERRDLSDLQASGLVPAVTGLQLGVVQAFEEDPDGQHRVKVSVPSIDATDQFVWARLTSADAGGDRGLMFRPEADDEVVLGFLNGDPRQAIVLGSVHSSKNAPPFPVSGKNEKKGFLSREGLKIEIDDDTKTVTLETPGGNKILMEDDSGITLKCKNGNELLLNKAGITLTSAKNVSVVGTNITIKGTKIDMK